MLSYNSSHHSQKLTHPYHNCIHPHFLSSTQPLKRGLFSPQKNWGKNNSRETAIAAKAEESTKTFNPLCSWNSPRLEDVSLQY